MDKIKEEAEKLLNEVKKFIEVAENELMPVDVDYLEGIEPRLKRITNTQK